MNKSLQGMQSKVSDLIIIARADELADGEIKGARCDDTDLVIGRQGADIFIFEGHCPHQGTLLSEGTIAGGILTCRSHGWRYACASGYKLEDSTVRLKRFRAIVDGPQILVDRSEVRAWHEQQPISVTKAVSAAAPPVRTLEQLPGPRGIPLLGNALQVRPEKLHLVLERWCRRYGPLYTFKVMGRPFVAISDPALIAQILRDRPGQFRRWDAIEAVTEEMGANGVFSAEGDAWRRQRAFVAKALDPAHLEAFFPTLRAMTRRLLLRWQKAAARQQDIDIRQDLMRYTVDVTTNLAFGYDMDTLQSEGDVIQRHLEVVFPMINRRINAPFPYWRYFKLPSDRALDRALAEVTALTKRLIALSRARVAQWPSAATAPANLLEALVAAQCEEQSPLTDEEVMANVLTILLAGEDTTANTIAWMVCLLSSRPHIQRKLQKEVDSAIGPRAMLETIDDCKSLVYLDAVANEAMRLKSVAPVLAVEPTRDVVVGNVAIPKGTVLSLLTRAAGLQPRIGTNSQAFDPDRWLNAATAASHHRAGFMPFGSGPRLCPGRSLALMEIRSAIAMLCRNFNISEATGPSDASEVFAFTMLPRHLRVVLAPRA